MKRNEIESIIGAYNNLIEHPKEKITLFGQDEELRWISDEDYEWLKPILEGQKKVEYTIGGLAIETTENMMPTVIKHGEKIYIRSRHLYDMHDIIEWLIFNYKRIKLSVLRDANEQINFEHK